MTAIGRAPGRVQSLLKGSSNSPVAQHRPEAAYEPRPTAPQPRQVCTGPGADAGARSAGPARTSSRTALTKAHSAAPLLSAPRCPLPAWLSGSLPALAGGVSRSGSSPPRPTPNSGALPGGRRAGAGLSDPRAGICLRPRPPHPHSILSRGSQRPNGTSVDQGVPPHSLSRSLGNFLQPVDPFRTPSPKLRVPSLCPSHTQPRRQRTLRSSYSQTLYLNEHGKTLALGDQEDTGSKG